MNQSEALIADYEAECTECGFLQKLRLHAGCGLKLGDKLYRSEDPNFDRCNRCKKQTMEITKSPEPLLPKKPQGFWRIPEE